LEKLKSREDVLKLIEDLKAQGKKVVTTNGSFDILHGAHVQILEKAKEQGDVLLVLLNSDSSIRENKGPKRPIIPEAERAFMLAALGCVDHIMVFSDAKVINVLKDLKPSVHVKGGTFIPERIKEEKELVESLGGKYVLLENIEGLSTTNIINKIMSSYL